MAASAFESPDEGPLTIFREVLQSVTREDPLEHTLDLICQRVCELAGFAFCGVLLPDEHWRRVHLAGSHNFPPRYVERLADLFLVPVGEQASGSPTRTAVEERRTVVLPDVLAEDSFAPWRPLAVEFGYRSLVSAPLIVESQVIGVLSGYSAEPREITDRQHAAVEALAAQAAVSLRLTMLIDQRQETIARLRESNEELERQRAVLERAHEIHRRLTAAVIVGTDFDGVARALADLISRPVAVTDADGRVVCTASWPPGDPVPDELGSASSRLQESLAAGRTIPAATGAIISPIRVATERLGYVVVPEGGPDSHDLDVRAVEHAATVLALEIVKERVARATEERLRADFLSDLLQGRRRDDEHVRERALRYGLVPGREHRVVVIVLDDDPSDRGDAARRAALLAAIADELGERIAGGLVGATTDAVTVVAPVDAMGDPVAALRDVVAAANARVQVLAPGATISAGVGGAARQPDQFAESHRGAELCIELIRRLGRRNETIVRDQLGLLGLFVDHRRPEELVDLARRTLGPAMERDEARNGSLVATLDAYLDHGGDVSACAQALYVHANTVKYRLRRVEELCGLNLRDPSDLLTARITTLTLRLL